MECNETMSKEHLEIIYEEANLDMLKVGLCGPTIAPFSLVGHLLHFINDMQHIIKRIKFI